MRYLPCLVLLFAMPLMAANVWKWRDANGVVNFSDRPSPGAEQVNISSPSTYGPPVLSEHNSASASSKSSTLVTYANVEIWKPSGEMTISNTAGHVEVAVRVEPALSSEHHLALYMDGRLVSGFPARGMNYELTEVERGAHTFTLAVVDAEGQQVKLSNPVQFYVQQPSILRRP